MTFHLYNTETREKEAIRPQHGNTIKLYTCGPTIYNFAHIGNFRTYVAEDLLRRALQFFGFQVDQAMNLTDIDDKTIRGAKEQGIALKEFTDPFRIAFFEDIETLKIQKAEHYPAATEFIPGMIRIVEKLLEQKIAYPASNGSIYFSIRKFPSYGRLSHFCQEDLKFNASGENEADEYGKEDATDFVLWKSYDPERDGNIYWESPFGKGRPGWHIECSAMAMEILGPSIDLHCGGVDNMFPHHENEIAQSECFSGRCFVKHWFHVEHLLVDHKKMSKSLGNFYTLRDLLDKGYTGSEVRYLLLSTHYRTQLNFTFEGLEGARGALRRIRDHLLRLSEVHSSSTHSIDSLLQAADQKFAGALAEDLNISAALAVLFDFLRELNISLDQNLLGEASAKKALQLYHKWDQVLGVLPFPESTQIPDALFVLLEKREVARREKNFRLSDQIRAEILHAGYLIEDTPQGPRLKKGES